MPDIMWFRRDLRLTDNPAWAAATMSESVLPVFVLEPDLMRASGKRRLSWLLASLRALDRRLESVGGRLHVVEGPAREAILRLVGDRGRVFWNADYSPFARRRDGDILAGLRDRAVVEHGQLVHRPGSVVKADGSSYSVFTPFWRKWVTVEWDLWPGPADTQVHDNIGIGVPSLNGPSEPRAGEAAAHDALDTFMDRLERYPDDRDAPGVDGTSRLSAHLKFGTIDARRVRATVGESTPAGAAFVRQLAWRDFYAGLLANDAECVDRSWNPKYRQMEWRTDEEGFASWASGTTGYPIVDAGMRQLAGTGFMHNRVRMITASFLVKDLQIDWRRGERLFRRQLVDADVASNVGNWQWVAGTGADAAPYFRVFNPIAQGERFDPQGTYVRRWVPEIAALPNRWVHKPWMAPPRELATAYVTIGDTYPAPIVDHASARREAIDRYKRAVR